MTFLPWRYAHQLDVDYLLNAILLLAAVSGGKILNPVAGTGSSPLQVMSLLQAGVGGLANTGLQSPRVTLLIS